MLFVTVLLQLLLKLLHIFDDVLSTNVVDASNNNNFQPVGHVEVIPPQRSGRVIDPATKYGVRTVVDLAWRQLLSAHTRAHRAGYVPVGVLSDLLSKPGPPCRVNICSSIT